MFVPSTPTLLLQHNKRESDSAPNTPQRSLTSSYFRNAAAVIYVYDETDAQTFKELSSWEQTASCYTNGAMSFVVGNKTDLLQPNGPRPVTEEQAQAFANSLFASLHHVSAQSGSGTEEAFNSITQQLIQQFVEPHAFCFSHCSHLCLCQTVRSLKRGTSRLMMGWETTLSSPSPSSRRKDGAFAERESCLHTVRSHV